MSLSGQRSRKISDMQYLKTVTSLLCLGLFAGPVAAQERTAWLTNLTACRTIEDGASRLACYDEATRALDEAERSGEVTIVDRNQVREARNRLFGFNVGGLGLFGRADRDPVEAIEAVLRGARQDSRGAWTFTLEDGAVWRQVDAEPLIRARAGDPVRIRQGAIGSYLMSVNGARSVRVRREQ